MIAKLKKLRHDLNLTQAEMAAKIGLSRNYLALMETGKRNIPAAVVERVEEIMTTRKKHFVTDSAVREDSPSYGCRFPAGCDLPSELAEMRAEMHDMRGKLDTLLGLLGGPLRASMGIGEDRPAGKAG